MAVQFSATLNAKATALPHFWEHTVGSGHATLALRADWQSQIKRVHEELGIRHVRFHGILSDDMSTLTVEGEHAIYSFFNADQIFDFLLSIGMKPFVELSFMPSALASGDKTAFHYRANVTGPKDLARWSVLIRKLVRHWIDRYGLAEVRQWYFEVWNEPNLTVFGSGKQDDYFELYRYTAEAIKAMDASLKVGGPATADNAWIADFMGFCAQQQVAYDFISTHHYPTDSFGKPDDDTVTQLADSKRSVLREEAREVRRQAGERPVYYTEWCTSSNPRDAMHDDPYAAAFIVKTVMEAQGLVQGYSYWAFSDIFEENYFPSQPFQGGFGLLTIHGVAKPSFRAYELLHGLGTETVPVHGQHETVDAWLIRGADFATVLLTNFALPRHPIESQSVSFLIDQLPEHATATIRRIDHEHANAKRRWEQMGKPDYLSSSMVAELHEASRMEETKLEIGRQGDRCEWLIEMPPQSVAAIRLQYGR
ncbi:beta-xylosidase [Dyella jejuensis]|uniref:Beta-xylosidase n=1 Tax=Dyella jejuensis TaxID=1432009 RepID=A0ABW8JKF1_9GAMM